MKKFIALLTVACLCVTGTFAETTATQKRVTYKTYKGDEYTMKVPKNWEQIDFIEEPAEIISNEDTDGNSSISVTAEVMWQDEYGSSINITREDMMGTSMRDYITAAKEGLLMLPGLTIVSQKKMRGGTLIVSEIKIDEISVHMEQLVLAHKGHAYIITTAGLSDLYKDYSKIFSTVLRSFKFKKIETSIVSEKPKKGDKVVVDFVGTYDNGEEFDSSKKEGRTPFEFTIGSDQVITGFEETIKTMKKGETKKVRLTPEEGYGKYASHPLRHKYLNFEITLIEIKTGS